MALAQVTRVLFDMDGLLLNTEDLYTRALNRFCAKYDQSFTIDLKLKMMGRKTDEAAAVLIEALNLPCTVEEYRRDLRLYQSECFSEAELLPGVERLVKHLHNHGIPIAIATASDRESYLLKTAHHGDFISLFNHVVLSGSDPEVKKGKPAPDVFLVALKRLASEESFPDAKQCLVFEDAPLGIEAALAAEMPCVLVPSLPEEYLDPKIISRATLKLKSLEEFIPEQFGLPAFPVQ